MNPPAGDEVNRTSVANVAGSSGFAALASKDSGKRFARAPRAGEPSAEEHGVKAEWLFTLAD